MEVSVIIGARKTRISEEEFISRFKAYYRKKRTAATDSQLVSAAKVYITFAKNYYGFISFDYPNGQPVILIDAYDERLPKKMNIEQKLNNSIQAMLQHTGVSSPQFVRIPLTDKIKLAVDIDMFDFEE